MSVLIQLVRKELLLLLRDTHALALLFVMPAFFILLMSLAMRDAFRPGHDRVFSYYLVNNDTTAAARRLVDALHAHRVFRDIGPGSDTARVIAIRRGGVFFAVVIPKGFTRNMTDSASAVPVRVLAGPAVSASITQLFLAAVREAVIEIYVPAKVSDMMVAYPVALSGGGFPPNDLDRLVEDRTLSPAGTSSVRPTSVQQNVPAWLVFAMFFVALPLSTTWLQERSQGTLARLRSIGVSPQLLLAGKLVPYLLVNVAQVVVMLAIGIWVVPALGGDPLTLGHSVAGLVVMTLAIGMAAVSYGLLIANLVTTTEQATIVTGATNLLLGALGGVMVPRSIMPPGLQHLSFLSPMAWGLEGFHDIFLRGGGVRMIATKAALLVSFALASLVWAGLRLRSSGVS